MVATCIRTYSRTQKKQAHRSTESTRFDLVLSRLLHTSPWNLLRAPTPLAKTTLDGTKLLHKFNLWESHILNTAGQNAREVT